MLPPHLGSSVGAAAVDPNSLEPGRGRLSLAADDTRGCTELISADCRVAAAQLLMTRSDDLRIAIILAAVSWLILKVVAAGPKAHARGSTPGERARRLGSAYLVMGTAFTVLLCAVWVCDVCSASVSKGLEATAASIFSRGTGVIRMRIFSFRSSHPCDERFVFFFRCIRTHKAQGYTTRTELIYKVLYTDYSYELLLQREYTRRISVCAAVSEFGVASNCDTVLRIMASDSTSS